MYSNQSRHPILRRVVPNMKQCKELHILWFGLPVARGQRILQTHTLAPAKHFVFLFLLLICQVEYNRVQESIRE